MDSVHLVAIEVEYELNLPRIFHLMSTRDKSKTLSELLQKGGETDRKASKYVQTSWKPFGIA
jgi:hypothetical protein